MISTHYLDTMPRWPAPEANRVVPRGIHGTTVYQTPAENRDLNLIEYSSVGVFVLGLALGVVYLEKWGQYADARGGRRIQASRESPLRIRLNRSTRSPNRDPLQ